VDPNLRGDPPKRARHALFIICVMGFAGVLCDWPHLFGIPDEHIVFANAMGLIALGSVMGAFMCGCDP